MKIKLLPLLFALAAGASQAQIVAIKDAWVRNTVPGQMATAAFMTLSARENAKLVAVTTPVAGVAEVHAMKMDGGVMKMRAVAGGLDLPAGRAVALTPGGYHIMLMDLKAALPQGSQVRLTLVFKDASGAESRMELQLPVSATADGAAHKP